MPPRAIYEHSGPAELVLEGENLTPDTLKLYHNGVLYTPLKSSDTYAYYLLGDNGTNKVMLNGKNFSTIIVKDIIVPTGLPTTIIMYQANAQGGGTTNRQEFDNVNCANYAVKATSELPNFRMVFGNNNQFEEFDETEWSAVGCVVTFDSIFQGRLVIKLKVQEGWDDTCYVTYQGFIIAVFNYSA